MKTVLIPNGNWNKLLILPLIFMSSFSMSSNIKPTIQHLISETVLKELGVVEKEIKYIESNKVNWPSSALGCVVEGQYYLPVITPGYLVKIQIKEEIYSVHTSETRAIICNDSALKQPKIHTKIATDRQSKQVKAIQLAREKFLQIDSEKVTTIKLLTIKAVHKSEFKQLCTSENVAMIGENGYLIALKKGDISRRFLSDGKGVVVCD
jgi:hypothetical protein